MLEALSLKRGLRKHILVSVWFFLSQLSAYLTVVFQKGSKSQSAPRAETWLKFRVNSNVLAEDLDQTEPEHAPSLWQGCGWPGRALQTEDPGPLPRSAPGSAASSCHPLTLSFSRPGGSSFLPLLQKFYLRFSTVILLSQSSIWKINRNSSVNVHNILVRNTQKYKMWILGQSRF